MIVLSYGFTTYDVTLHFWLRLGGFLSSMLAVGYYVCSPTTTPGKISYAGVVIITIGVAFNILHWTGANESIIVGLIVFGIPYAADLIRKQPEDQNVAK